MSDSAGTAVAAASATANRDSPDPGAVEMTLDAAVEEYLEELRYRRCSPWTIRCYRSDLAQLRQSVADAGEPIVLSSLDRRALQRFARSIGHLAPATVRRKLNAVASFVGYCVDESYLGANPMSSIKLPKVPKQLPRSMTEEDLQALLGTAMTDTERAIVFTLALTGTRRSELLGLNCRDIDWDAASIRVRGKGDKERDLPMTPDVRRILSDYLGARRLDRDGPVIINSKGRRMSESVFQRLFRRVVRRAGLGDRGYTPHSLRHTCATMLVRAGVDIATIAELMGHADISTTAKYLSSNSRLKEAALKSLPIRVGWGDAEPAHSSAEAAEVGVEVQRGSLERSMPEDALKGTQIASAAKSQGGEGVAQSV